MANFTPVSAAIGGALIGFAATLLMLINGILPKPPRSAGGHRLYANEHKQRLVFIRRSRALGFSLRQVRLLLGLSGGRRLTCAKVKSITQQHITEIRLKIKDLRRLERVLSDMAAQWRGDELPECPILEALASK